jgi:hypothetical protein
VTRVLVTASPLPGPVLTELREVPATDQAIRADPGRAVLGLRERADAKAQDPGRTAFGARAGGSS